MNRWPLRVALECFYPIARERALEHYRHEQLMYALQAPWAKEKIKPPERPGILGD